MKIEPGMLCMLVNIVIPDLKGNNGRLVKTVALVEPGDWEVLALSPLMTRPSGMRPAGSYLRCYTQHLRPITDPGDDAVDEMVLIVGKPQKETV